MAENLASIYGTEKDRVNCPFYFKIGACRHGERCSRMHNKPLFSQTLLLENFFLSPESLNAAALAVGAAPPRFTEAEAKEHFENFYADAFCELYKVGNGVEEMHICENLSDHLAGNAYVKFADEEGAQAALENLQGRFYGGRQLKAEYSPVTDFREARCRPFERSECDRGDYCNFMHIRRLPDPLSIKLYGRIQPQIRRRDDYGGRGGRGGFRGGFRGGRGDDRRGPPPRSHNRRPRDHESDQVESAVEAAASAAAAAINGTEQLGRDPKRHRGSDG